MEPAARPSPVPLPSSLSHMPEPLHITRLEGHGELPHGPTPSSMDLDRSVAVQLASQTSHLSLSVSGNNTEAAPIIPSSLPPVPISTGHPEEDALHLAADAQRYLRAENLGATVAETMSSASHPSVPLEASEEASLFTVEMPLVPASSKSPGGTGANVQMDVEARQKGAANRILELARSHPAEISHLPNEVLLEILGYLDVCDLLSTSRASRHFRNLSLAPILHHYRLQRTRTILPPMLDSPFRPSLADLIARSIFLTNTTVVSRKLARSLVSIRLSRRLAARPSPEALVARSVLPPECVPGKEIVAPALVAKKRAVERERVKDGLRRWVGNVWKGEVRSREEGVRRWEERVGVGRVWKLRRFWETVGRGEMARIEL